MVSRKALVLALVLSGSIVLEFPAQGVEAAALVVAQAGQKSLFSVTHGFTSNQLPNSPTAQSAPDRARD